MTSSGEAVFFWIVAIAMVAGALGVVFARKAVYAAISMVMIMALLGVTYIAQGAEFLGIIQIFVYTGAVMMLFLFVIMLVGVDASDSFVEVIKGHRWLSLLVALGLAVLLISTLGQAVMPDPVGLDAANRDGNPGAMANLIFGPDVWVFEITSALLITAALAAMTLAHRERLLPKPKQREWSQRRFLKKEDLKYAAGLPAPGVYARHNAVDTPALLPDGTPSELSVSRVLRAREQIGAPDTYIDATEDVTREIGEGTVR